MHSFWAFFDKHYLDKRIERLYENLHICENKYNNSDGQSGEQLTILWQ